MFGSIRSLLSDMNSGDIDYVYLPYNNSGTHWILGVADVRVSAVIILDPISINYQPSNKSHKEAVFIASEILNKRFSKEVIELKTIRHSLQHNTSSCGVYCCFYASQISQGKLIYFSSNFWITFLVWVGLLNLLRITSRRSHYSKVFGKRTVLELWSKHWKLPVKTFIFLIKLKIVDFLPFIKKINFCTNIFQQFWPKV